jgi:hypothetical protein
VFVAVGAHHHRQRIPAHEAADALLDFVVAGIDGLPFDGNRVDVRRVCGEGKLGSRLRRMSAELLQQRVGALGTALPDDVVERLQPLPGFDLIDIGLRRFRKIAHRHP